MKKLLVLLLMIQGGLAYAQIGATPEQCVVRYGKPEREEYKAKGLLFFHQNSLYTIAHFYEGHCDMLSLFSDKDEMGFPSELSDEEIAKLLASEGGVGSWDRVERFSINGVWNSPDKKSFAIYDTMRHKLVIMTRAAYKREKGGLP